jgi:glutathionyl-hydroquinone reductase
VLRDQGRKHQLSMSEPEPLFGVQLIRGPYFWVDPNNVPRFTVLARWDTKTSTIVNNESSELITTIRREFNKLANHRELGLYPEGLRDEIGKTTDLFYNTLSSDVSICDLKAHTMRPFARFSRLWKHLRRGWGSRGTFGCFLR